MPFQKGALEDMGRLWEKETVFFLFYFEKLNLKNDLYSLYKNLQATLTCLTQIAHTAA